MASAAAMTVFSVLAGLMIEDGGEGRFFVRIGSECRCRDDEGQ
jgi:hypothetical protein